MLTQSSIAILSALNLYILDYFVNFVHIKIMKYRIYRFFLVLLSSLCLAIPEEANACTSFIVSGKVTKDGRPLIFKNRDTGNVNNVVVVMQII